MLNIEDEVSVDCTAPAVDLQNVAIEMNEEPTPFCQVKLYNFGTTCHISPYCKHFENLIDILDKLFTVADYQKIVVTRIGNMIVKALNGYDILCLCLTKILFLPNIRYMLIFIDCLNELGLSMMFAEEFCTI